ncbi:MAG: hypothetical protein HYU03_04310 [Thaumarchaeota archaeon]|nr:hypothetical protein [Nitrososphaerota archaeon]
MAEFLVINTQKTYDNVDTKGCVNYWMALHRQGKARIMATCGLKGYAIFLNVNSHEELNKILEGNPIRQYEEYTIYPLTPIKNVEA